MAAHFGSENVVRLLINYGADVNFMAKVCRVTVVLCFIKQTNEQTNFISRKKFYTNMVCINKGFCTGATYRTKTYFN